MTLRDATLALMSPIQLEAISRLFSHQWVCKAPELSLRCHNMAESVLHYPGEWGCGYRYVASLLPDDFQGIFGDPDE